MPFRSPSKPLIIAATATALVFGVSGYVWKEEHRPHVLDVYVFNLPSGRSLFIRTPDDYRVLIDGGSNSDVIRDLTGIIPFYSRRIDALMATNADGKNVSGLVDVLDRYHVDHIYIPGVTLASLGLAGSSDSAYEALLERAGSTQADIHELLAGNTILLGGQVSLKAHFPAAPAAFSYSRASGPEALYTVSYGSTAVTFLGSASHKVQEFLAATSSGMRSVDAVIVSHSALPANMSVKLMDRLQPRYLIYSKANPKASAPAVLAASTTLIAPAAPAAPPASAASKKPAKIPADSLVSVPADHRLNLQEKGTIHLVSDGSELTVK